ncbi:MAG: pimeloyl-ACP methyl ester carboxylesterase [Pirellulaceae bacterium]|jgi:pimeloyl-ACP methyl ester carboxylesterase
MLLKKLAEFHRDNSDWCIQLMGGRLCVGGKPSERLQQAKLASATTHVGKGDPPIILLYGSKDKSLVKPLHGERLHAKYQEAGLTSTYQLIEGAGHGGPQYRDEVRSKMILDMLQKTLRQ